MNAIAAFSEHVVPHSRQSDFTRRNTLSRLKRWARISGDPDVREISTASLVAYRQRAAAAGIAADTIESDISAVLLTLKMCHRAGLTSVVPWAGTRLRRRSSPRPVPTLEQIGRCYAHAAVASWPHYMDAGQFWRTWYVVSLWCGMRRNDVLFRITREMCSRDAIRCTAAKTGRHHIFPMHPVVWRHIDAMPKTDRLFDVGRSLKQVRRELDRISDAAGVSPRIQPQAMRRASITAWEECAGAGRIIHGCAADVVTNHYLAVRKPPKQLIDGVGQFPWPSEMLTAEDRNAQRLETAQFLRMYRQLSERDRERVRSITERLVS